MTAPGELIGLVLTGSAAARVGVEPFIMELIAGIEEELAPHGITVLVVVVPDLGAELDTYRRWADDRTVQAVVVVNLVHDDVRLRAHDGLAHRLRIERVDDHRLGAERAQLIGPRARRAGDVVAAGDQLGHEPAAQGAGRPGDEDP